jgi:hypothetical protein
MTVASPATAEILTVCQSANTPAASPVIGSLLRVRNLADAEATGLIALSQDERGFDIVENFGQSSQHSLRDSGDEILGLPLSNELVHLVVEHQGGGLEHFLFSLDEEGTGELLRSAEGDALSADANGVSSTAMCTRPR